MVVGEHMVFNFKIESSGEDHSQEGVALSKEEWEGGMLASCARGTRTLRRCSLDARSGSPSNLPSSEKVGRSHDEKVAA